jgi:hypothetical protein
VKGGVSQVRGVFSHFRGVVGQVTVWCLPSIVCQVRGVGSAKSELWSAKSEVRSAKSEVRLAKSEVWSTKSEM